MDHQTPAQRAHNQRATGLRQTFNEEGLAEFLHQTYRAAFKALHNRKDAKYIHSTTCTDEHDHGFAKCHRKKYFLRRARFLLKDLKYPQLVGF